MQKSNFNEDNTATSLYRIPDEVKYEILQALNMWNLSLNRDRLLCEKALLCLKNPYSTTANKTSDTKEMSSQRQDQLDKITNGINDFKSFLIEQIHRAPEHSQESLNKTLESFTASINNKL